MELFRIMQRALCIYSERFWSELKISFPFDCGPLTPLPLEMLTPWDQANITGKDPGHKTLWCHCVLLWLLVVLILIFSIALAGWKAVEFEIQFSNNDIDGSGKRSRIWVNQVRKFMNSNDSHTHVEHSKSPHPFRLAFISISVSLATICTSQQSQKKIS